MRVFWVHLAEDPVKMVFSSHLRRNINHILEVVRSMESEGAMFHAATGARCCGNLRKHWWTPEVKRAVKLKKETHSSWLACGTPDS